MNAVPPIALHELLGEPTGNAADDDGGNPTDLVLFHWWFLRAGAAKYPTILLIRIGGKGRHGDRSRVRRVGAEGSAACVRWAFYVRG